jgi:hypothetical protein
MPLCKVGLYNWRLNVLISWWFGFTSKKPKSFKFDFRVNKVDIILYYTDKISKSYWWIWFELIYVISYLYFQHLIPTQYYRLNIVELLVDYTNLIWTHHLITKLLKAVHLDPLWSRSFFKCVHTWCWGLLCRVP